MNLGRLFRAAAGRSPRAPALTAGGVTLDYGSLQTAVDTATAGMGAGIVVADGAPTVPGVARLLAALDVAEVLVLGEAAPARLADRAPRPAPPEIVFPTSGSSGTPKRVRHTHTTLAAALRSTLAFRHEQLGGDPLTAAEATLADLLADDRVVLTVIPGLPLWTISGFAMLAFTLLSGGHLVLADVTAPGALLDAVARHGANNIGAPPTLLRALAREQSRAPRDLSSLFLVGVGSGPLDADLARNAEATLGAPIVNAYGSTETGGAVLMPRIDDPPAIRVTTVGRPLPGVEIRTATDGELLVRTDALAPGRAGPDGWYRTGDVATVDTQGDVRIVGRLDDQILRGGRLIDPAPIEAVVASHPGVREVAVVGVPSRVPGELDVCVAYVGPAAAPFRDALRARCMAVLPAHQRPRRFVAVGEIPHRRDGSPHRAAVRARLTVPHPIT